jgi:hypothetical protein
MRPVIVLSVLALAAAAAAAEPVWDYLPVVGYAGDSLWFALRVGQQANEWTASAPSGPLEAKPSDGSVGVDLLPKPQDDRVEFIHGQDRVRVRLARPGAGKGLELDARWRPRLDGEPAVLIVDRTEADADRRWKLFRAIRGPEAVACELQLEAPTVPAGESGLLAEICAAQRLAVEDKSVLVLLPGGDRLAGWKHREYRQAVAWLVSDALARGAAHVVLAGPIAPKADAAALAPLTDAVADVAVAYHCRLVDLGKLCDDEYWAIAPGFLGPELNPQGKAALTAALAPWRR